jgi:hypothetical protein
MDLFVAMQGGSEETERFYNGQEVTVGFDVTNSQMDDNLEEPHYKDWEDDLQDLEPDYSMLGDTPDDAWDGSITEEMMEGLFEDDEDEAYSEEKIYEDSYLVSVPEEDPGIDFVEFEGYDGCFRSETIDDDKLLEPEMIDGSSKGLSWSEAEWNDIKCPGEKVPQVIDPSLVPEIKKKYEVVSYQRVYSWSRFYFSYLDKYRRDTRSSTAYGYVRIGDVLFKMVEPMVSTWRPGMGGRQVRVKAETYIVPIEKRGIVAYCLLPHDRLFQRRYNFNKRSSNRISYNIDLDLVTRYQYFSHTRCTQVYIGCVVMGLKPGEKMRITVVPQGKQCLWDVFPYLEVSKNGFVGGMIDMGAPPFWNKQQAYDLVFQGERSVVNVSGYLKFWMTHLFHGTRMCEPSLIRRVCDSTYSGSVTGLVVNPTVMLEKKYSTGFTSSGEDMRRGTYMRGVEFFSLRLLERMRHKRWYPIKNGWHPDLIDRWICFTQSEGNDEED